MEALKFLRPGRVGPFSRVTWPEPGTWLESEEAPELCRAGIHALLPEVLSRWVAEELWRVELEDEETVAPGIVVAPRARLFSRVEEWNDETAREFARACASHVRDVSAERAAEYAADAKASAEEAVADFTATTVAYMAAHAAEAQSPGGYESERLWQSRWLAERLGVASPQHS
jgi:hypothetical protein